MRPAAEYDRRIQFLRATKSENTFGEPAVTGWAALGDPVPAKVGFGTGMERREASALGAVQTATFRTRRSALARSVTKRDRFIFAGATYGITAIADFGRGEDIEFTGKAETVSD